jgi:ERCC4-type nuclease
MLEKDLHFDYETKALHIGDIEISDENYILVIERKTWTDLQSSIKDNRFREQRSRLLEWRENNKEQNGIVYVIEGMYDGTLFELERSTLERLMIAYQIPVIFTGSLQRTCDLIEKWSNLKSLESLFRKRSLEEDQMESRMKSRTKKNFTDSKLFLMENLCSIRGISVSIAQSITNEYPSMYIFVKTYLENKEEWETTMKSLQYLTSGGNKRKISPKIIHTIKENFSFVD